MGSTWEMVSGEAFVSWLQVQLRNLSDSLHLEIVDGDQVVQDVLEEMRDELGELVAEWKQKVALHAEALKGAWFLDQSVTFPCYSKRVPAEEMDAHYSVKDAPWANSTAGLR